MMVFKVILDQSATSRIGGELSLNPADVKHAVKTLPSV